ncbi:unnamed protein product [Polarella glacialis]|uniref:DNA polymerase n=1 Tax=Polarella glacialis TaxID=89957 RepID=A0A813GQK4_POLGL|nr:unnamed protein product [Polarella glacialis]CAE8640408.1 unnamed protein product [Polarella glacialis]
MAPKPMRQAADTSPLFGVLLVIEVLALLLPQPPPTGPSSSSSFASRGGPPPAASPLLPRPSEVGAVAYCIRDERVRSLLAEIGRGQDYEDVYGVICLGTAPVGLGPTTLVQSVASEVALFDAVGDLFKKTDPSVVLGYDVVNGSLGLLLTRATALGLRNFAQRLARAPPSKLSGSDAGTWAPDVAQAASQADPGSPGEGGTGAPRKLYPPEQVSGGLELTGRLVLNVWRILRGEAKLPSSSLQTAAQDLLGETLPLLPPEALAERWKGPPCRQHARLEALRSLLRAAGCCLRLLDSLNVLPRAAETARMLGIDVLSVLSRGSQYRVEGLLTRAAHRDRLLLLSPSKLQVAAQRSAECIPLVMEPRSGFYFDPVVVLDFQSLYPSIVIAYNLCFSTCAGRLDQLPGAVAKLGVLEAYRQPPGLKREELEVMPNETLFVKRQRRPGVLPRMLYEILQTRIMVKKALKEIQKGNAGDAASEGRARLLDARQFGLKMIANVTYGYTAASFSGRMPCVELADAIVQTARRTLERAVRWVEREVEGAEVVYGDTDSLFVRLPGRTKEAAFEIGARIAREVTSQNPRPVELQMDKVYWPCCLASKKRYVGHAWSSPQDTSPVFDAKGIETIRRDQCAATQYLLRGALEAFFNSRGDLSWVRRYLQEHALRLRAGRFSLQDFIFNHEVRLPDEYKGLGPLAAQAVRRGGGPWPSPGERVPFVVAQGPPGSRLSDVAVHPLEVTGGRPTPAAGVDTTSRAPMYLDIEYYLGRQIGPPLHRLFMLARGPGGEQPPATTTATTTTPTTTPTTSTGNKQQPNNKYIQPTRLHQKRVRLSKVELGYPRQVHGNSITSAKKERFESKYQRELNGISYRVSTICCLFCCCCLLIPFS